MYLKVNIYLNTLYVLHISHLKLHFRVVQSELRQLNSSIDTIIQNGQKLIIKLNSMEEASTNPKFQNITTEVSNQHYHHHHHRSLAKNSLLIIIIFGV